MADQSTRDYPYGAFNFRVKVLDMDGEIACSDVSGLSTEITASEYRTGADAENHVRKIPGLHKVGDVTLKRGVISSKDFWDWIRDTRTKGPAAKRTVTISLKSEDGSLVQSWKLDKVFPLKYTGPTFAAKGGNDVAMEELVLSAESIEVEANS